MLITIVPISAFSWGMRVENLQKETKSHFKIDANRTQKYQFTILQMWNTRVCRNVQCKSKKPVYR